MVAKDERVKIQGEDIFQDIETIWYSILVVNTRYPVFVKISKPYRTQRVDQTN